MAKNFLKSGEAGFLAGAKILAFIFLFTIAANAQPGLLDITFNPGSGQANPATYCMALQTNGQIAIGGDFSDYNGASRVRVARINADGSLDSSFDPGVGPNSEVQAIAVQPDGKILIGGQFSSLNGSSWRQPARFRLDGSVDTSFDTSSAHGAGANSPVLAITLQPDGKILIGGGFTTVGGNNYNSIARLNTNGTLDVTFNPGTGITNSTYPYVYAIGLQSDGRIIVGGTFTAINGVSRNYLARLNSDGSLDTNFNAGFVGVGRAGVFSLAILPQDKIVLCGSFSSINGYSRPGIARLNADGSVDTTFNPGFGVDGATSLAVQGDGKIIIGGGFSYVNNTNRTDIARVNADGTLDLTFNPGTGTDFTVYCVGSQPDGKALIGGNFYHFNGTNIHGIARLNGDTSSTTLNLLNPKIYFGMNLSGVVSNSYRIEYTSQFNTPSLWTPLFNVTLQTNPQFIFDPNPASGQRFYRAVALP